MNASDPDLYLADIQNDGANSVMYVGTHWCGGASA